MQRLVFFKVSCGLGMDATEVHDCVGMTDEEIGYMASELAVDCAGTYGDFVWEDTFTEWEEAGGDMSRVFTDSDLSYHWEDYVPEKHDMFRAGGGSFMDEFKE